MTARMPAPPNAIPTIFVAFGATGDLMQRKVIPALYHLHTRSKLPQRFRIVGFSRRDWSDQNFGDYIRTIIEKRAGAALPDEMVGSFISLFRFQKGEFDNTGSYADLKRAFDECDAEWGLCANKLFYLAVAP